VHDLEQESKQYCCSCEGGKDEVELLMPCFTKKLRISMAVATPANAPVVNRMSAPMRCFPLKRIPVIRKTLETRALILIVFSIVHWNCESFWENSGLILPGKSTTKAPASDSGGVF